MSRYARIVSGVVAEIVSLPDDISPAEAFHADVAETFVSCPNTAVLQGWIYSNDASGGDVFDAPAAVIPTAAQLIAYANAKQWALATGGYTTSIGAKQVTLSTSVESIALMNSAVQRQSQANPPSTIIWQLGAVSFAQFAAADFVAAAVKAADFVQATFSALPAVLAAIQAGTTTTLAQVDAASWPASTG